MPQGKGTDDFDAYINNLQQAMVADSIGSQLGAGTACMRVWRSLVHNPYATTIAQMGVLRLRTIRTRAQ